MSFGFNPSPRISGSRTEGRLEHERHESPRKARKGSRLSTRSRICRSCLPPDPSPGATPFASFALFRVFLVPKSGRFAKRSHTVCIRLLGLVALLHGGIHSCGDK